MHLHTPYYTDPMSSSIDQVEMQARDLLARRNRLSRHYDMVALSRAEHLGFVDSQQSLQRVLRQVESQFLPHYFGSAPKWRLRLRRLSGRRTLPDFCVLGPWRSGTSDCAVTLMLHPNILPPFVKEFWSSDPEEWRIFYPTERQKRAHADRYGLAASPYLMPCLHRIDIPYRLSRFRHETKVVILLREPTERTYSHWKCEFLCAGRKCAEQLPFLSTFGAYVRTSLSLFGKSPMFTACGAEGLHMSIYWKATEFWVKCFSRENVLVLDIGNYLRTDANFFARCANSLHCHLLNSQNSQKGRTPTPCVYLPLIPKLWQRCESSLYRITRDCGL